MKRGHREQNFIAVVAALAEQKPLHSRYRDHALTGNYITFRECHIEPDWLLIYRVNTAENTLELARTGTHSDLF